MVKQSRNCNAPEGSKAPLLEEIDGTTLLENQQFEHDHPDQFQSAEKQAFEQRMLEMESLLRAVVHDNNNFKTRLEDQFQMPLMKSLCHLLTIFLSLFRRMENRQNRQQDRCQLCILMKDRLARVLLHAGSVRTQGADQMMHHIILKSVLNLNAPRCSDALVLLAARWRSPYVLARLYELLGTKYKINHCTGLRKQIHNYKKWTRC